MGCSPVKPPPSPTPQTQAASQKVPPPAAIPAAAQIEAPVVTNVPVASGHPITSPRHISIEAAGILLDGIAFDSRTHRLEVADQPSGPGSQWADSQSAGRARHGIAAINAGFFTPEGAPLGLVVSAGTVRGGWNGASSLGSAVWYVDGGGRSAITRREKLGSASARRMSELIQAGPLLVENRSPVGGLDNIKSSPRTVLLWDGGTRWMMARSGACTLQQISQALAGASPAGWPVATALNFDGGRSAEIWISDQVTGGGAFTRPIWNKPVRNFLVLKPVSP
ncbi:phosphodiester glycosidase family protein [Luteolibacter ambystomatis]